MQDLWRKTAHELAALVRKRELSPLEVLDAHLAVIERLNPKLNAIVTLATDSARAAARAAEQAVTRGDKLGPLHGLPIGIKDIVATANIRTTYGCPLYADNVPTEDAEVVRRLKAAGAIVEREPYGFDGMPEDILIATLADPDGNLFQLMSPMDPDSMSGSSQS